MTTIWRGKSNMEVLTIAAYLAHAALNTDSRLLPEREGQLELIQQITGYADYICQARDEVHEYLGDSPGVFEYEVVEELGKAFLAHVIHQRMYPDHKVFMVTILAAIETWYTQGGLTEEQEEGIQVILAKYIS